MTEPLRIHNTQGSLRRVEKSAEPVHTDWIIPGLVARGNVTLLAGAEKAGKSLLAMQYAAGCAGTSRTAYVDAENGEVLIQQRIAQYATPPAVYDARGFDLDQQLGQVEAILAEGYDFLVLDTWRSLWKGSESSDRDVSRVLMAIGDMARQYNVGVLLLSHTTKGTQTYRGSGAIGASVHAVFTLTRGDRDGERTLTCTAMRFAPEPPALSLTLGSDGTFRVEPPRAVGGVAIGGKSAAPPPPVKAPSFREINRMREQKAISKREQRRLLRQAGADLPPARWWRLGK